jgi:hypothetical protein
MWRLDDRSAYIVFRAGSNAILQNVPHLMPCQSVNLVKQMLICLRKKQKKKELYRLKRWLFMLTAPIPEPSHTIMQ